ncbi:MAG TPA: recombination protein RecR [Bacteroidetes bacterium]|nr:recombination protein RecR [Bacteroidota bacterium]
MLHQYSSKLLDEAVREFSKLPGIGKKTALRLVLYLLRQDEEEVTRFGESMIRLRKEIKHCRECNNISDTDICEICANPRRDRHIVCVVESIRDVISIENTQQYNGLYHVLGGIISPMDGVGPGDLETGKLEEKIKQGAVKEMILALSTTMEGDTTNFYLYRKFHNYDIEISILARGVSFGDELEYADEITLGRSIINRQPFRGDISR